MKRLNAGEGTTDGLVKGRKHPRGMSSTSVMMGLAAFESESEELVVMSEGLEHAYAASEPFGEPRTVREAKS